MTTEELLERCKKEHIILAQVWMEEDLERLLKKTRAEPGLPIATVAKIIQESWSWQEIDHLKELL
jgi:hypothetical protein